MTTTTHHPTMTASSDHSDSIKSGLRRAVANGSVLGGLRSSTQKRNQESRSQALQRALDYRDVLEAGRDKSLSALSRDLFKAGCSTSSGKPLTPEMVRRLRARLAEALEAGEP